VNGPPQSGWNERARKFGWTVLFVSIVLSFAVDVLRAIAPVLMLGAVVGGIVYVSVLVARYQRSRW